MNFLQWTRLKQANLSRALTIQAALRVQWCLPAQAILTEKKAREDTEEALLRMMEVTAASSSSDKNPCLPHPFYRTDQFQHLPWLGTITYPLSAGICEKDYFSGFPVWWDIYIYIFFFFFFFFVPSKLKIAEAPLFWEGFLQDTVAKMRAEIAQERADRETTEETLLKLLEVPMLG